MAASGSGNSSPPIPAREIYPVISELPTRYSHIYLTLMGSIRFHGDSVPSHSDMYQLIKAEANDAGYPELYKDVLDLLMWIAVQNPRGCVHTMGESSIFFGPNALVTKIVPPIQAFILSKREGFKEDVIDVKIEGDGPWTLKEKDWMIEIELTGHVKKLTAEEASRFSKESKGLYIKSDKYNPYYMNGPSVD